MRKLASAALAFAGAVTLAGGTASSAQAANSNQSVYVILVYNYTSGDVMQLQEATHHEKAPFTSNYGNPVPNPGDYLRDRSPYSYANDVSDEIGGWISTTKWKIGNYEVQVSVNTEGGPDCDIPEDPNHKVFECETFRETEGKFTYNGVALKNK